MAEQGTTTARRRVALTREAIVEAGIRLCSPEGGGVLTFSRLGKELGADPTAVYRHFRDKDELILAMTDVMVEEAVALANVQALGPDRWRESLAASARAVRAVYLERPALAVLAAIRTTASTAETASVEQIIGVLHGAGLPVIQAAECYRMLLDLTLAMTQASAAFMVLDEESQAKDDAAWAVRYGLLPAARYPLLHESAPRLTELFRDDAQVFELVLGTFLDGIALKIEQAVAERGSAVD